MSMARKGAVQVACVLLVAAFLATAALGNRTYRDTGPGDVDKGRNGSAPCSHETTFTVKYLNVTRLCNSKPIAAVNGLYPGPPLYVREGDTVIVHVNNEIDHNLTIHWHGLRQLLQNWQDGPAYFTQCPIQPGQSFTYNFTISDQKRGTVWWHAHITWLRATVHGALIILPRLGQRYPFSIPQGENVLIFGEWFQNDTEAIQAIVVRNATINTASQALTINGQPGDLYNCSSSETSVLNVEAGKLYMLRLVNAALNFDLYFSIANHTLVVVEADGEYTKPFSSSVVLITPGQTMNVLLSTNQRPGNYYMAATVWSPVSPNIIAYPATPATARLQYSSASNAVPTLPQFPAANDSQWAFNFEGSIRSLNSAGYLAKVPTNIDENLLFAVGYGFVPCDPDQGCNMNTRISLTINNNTFFTPKTSILEAYYYNISNVYTADFPDNPPFVWNFTGPNPPTNTLAENKTRVKVLQFGAEVQLVLQNHNILFFESHPFHLHGFSFYVVGAGFGNFNATRDTPNFNLINPPLRNTVQIPAGGWTAIRWTAANPGVWLMHCHLEIHQSWGMELAFIVHNGVGPNQTLPSPPPNLPKC